MSTEQQRAPVEVRVPSPVVEQEDDRFAAAGVRLLVKRDDLVLKHTRPEVYAGIGRGTKAATRLPSLD